MSIESAFLGNIKYSDSDLPGGYSPILPLFCLFSDLDPPTEQVESPWFTDPIKFVNWLDEYFNGISWNVLSMIDYPYMFSDRNSESLKRIFPTRIQWGYIKSYDNHLDNSYPPGSKQEFECQSSTGPVWYTRTITGTTSSSYGGSARTQTSHKFESTPSSSSLSAIDNVPFSLFSVTYNGWTTNDDNRNTLQVNDPAGTFYYYATIGLQIFPPNWIKDNKLNIPVKEEQPDYYVIEPPMILTIRLQPKMQAVISKASWFRLTKEVYEAYNGTPLNRLNPDPWEPGGPSGPGGGDGDFEDKNIDVPAPSAPSGVISGTDGFNLYRLTSSSFKSLINYMWSAGFDLDTLKKMVTDPMSTIIGSHIVPVSPPTSSPEEIVLGNITASNVFGSPVTNRFVQIDCGTLDISKYSGTFLDYSPYTKYQLFLPFIGFREISADDVTGKTIGIKYTFDVVTGACVAFISVNNTVLYSFSGQAAAEIPLSGSLYGNALSAAISSSTSVAVGLASGGVGGAISAVSGMASAVLAGSKPTFERSGAFGGVGGFMGIRTPYIAKTRPRQAIPEHLNEFTGYPTYISGYLNSYKGYTEVESVHLTDIPATDTELAEIETILKGGVIL